MSRPPVSGRLEALWGLQAARWSIQGYRQMTTRIVSVVRATLVFVPLPNPRVAFIGLNYHPEHTGIAPYTSAMARGLARRGHPVRVLTTHPHYPSWKVAPGYGQWIRDQTLDHVHVRRLKHYVPRKPRGLARLLSELSFGVRAIFSRWGHPEAIVLVSPALFSSVLVMLRARLSRSDAPVVVWVQDLYTLGLAETGQGDGLSVRVARAAEGWLLRSADRVVVIHDRFASRVRSDFRVPQQRITTVRNWTHLQQRATPDVATVRERFGWGTNEVIVLHSGNMGVKQGLNNVIEAAKLSSARQSPVRFVLLGDGSEREALESSAIGVSAVQFIRPLDDAAFAEALAGADVLLVNERPGVAEMAVPSKLTSYFAAARPVLAATDSTGITADEIRAAQAGIVVPAGTPEALLDAALALGADPEERRKFGAAGRRYRETVLDEEHAVDCFIQILDEVSTDD